MYQKYLNEKYEGRYLVLMNEMQEAVGYPLRSLQVSEECAKDISECSEDNNARVVTVGQIVKGEVKPIAFAYDGEMFYPLDDSRD